MWKRSIGLAVAFCAACIAPTNRSELHGVRAEWTSPERVPGGGELPKLRIETTGAFDDVRYELRAFRDLDHDGSADNAEKQVVTRGRLHANEHVEVTGVRLLAPEPLRWTLQLRTPEAESNFDLGWVR